MIYVIWDNGSSAMKKFIPLRSLHSFLHAGIRIFLLIHSFLAFILPPFVVREEFFYKIIKKKIFLAHFISESEKLHSQYRRDRDQRSSIRSIQIPINSSSMDMKNFHKWNGKSSHKSKTFLNFVFRFDCMSMIYFL